MLIETNTINNTRNMPKLTNWTVRGVVSGGNCRKTPALPRGTTTTSSKLGVQFFGLEYYYPSTGKNSTGLATLVQLVYSSKSYVKTEGVRPNFGGPDPPTPSGCTHGLAPPQM